MKKVVAILLVLAMVFALSGCAGQGRVVAKVNGTKIYSGEVYEVLGYYAPMYGLDPNEPSSDLRMLQLGILDALIREAVILQHADAAGLNADNAELLAEAQAAVDEQITSIKDAYRSTAEILKESDPDLDVDAYVEEAYGNYLADLNTSEEQMLQNAVENLQYDKMYARITDGEAVTEEEVQRAYDALVTDQQAQYAQDLTAYATQSEVIVYRPAGYRYVKHILITFDEETQNKLEQLYTAGDAAFETEAAAAAEGLADKVEEISAKIEAGEDFDALIATYSQDIVGMYDAETLENGMLVCEGAAFVEPFLSTALALEKPGDVSEPIVTSYGVHFIMFASEVQEEILPYEDVRDDIEANLLEEVKSTQWDIVVAEWVNASKIKYFIDRL